MADEGMLKTLESVLGCLSGVVVALDRDARVITGNPAFLEVQRQQAVCPDVAGEFLSLLRPEDHGLFMLRLNKLRATNALFSTPPPPGQVG